MAVRRMIRSNQPIGMTIKKSDWGSGWIFGQCGCGWSLFTLYIDQSDGWSFYRAIPDIDRGIDVEDEKLIVRTPDLYWLTCVWHAKWQEHRYGNASTKTKDTWEGKMAQATCLNSIAR